MKRNVIYNQIDLLYRKAMNKEEKPVPSWAHSVVRNYKEQFKAAHNRETKLSDRQVFVCFNNRSEYETSEETDEGVVDDMFDKERALGHHPDNDFGPSKEEIGDFSADKAKERMFEDMELKRTIH